MMVGVRPASQMEVDAAVAAAAPAPRAGLLMAVYAASGACSLIDEVVWVRLLKLTLGNTVQAGAVVAATFLGGLALGGWWMGRRADRRLRPLRTYAMLEAAVTAAALAMPAALRAAEGLYAAAFGALESAPAALAAMQVGVSAALLLVPTVLMGATLPLLGRCVTAAGQHAGHRVGRLYAANMLGAAVGCALAGVVLLRLAGVWGAVLAAAGLNALVAAAAWAMSARGEAPDTAAPCQGGCRRSAPPDAKASAATRGGSVTSGTLLLAACFVSGLVALGCEMIWMRSIALPLGGYTYVFSAVLTAYLLGNVAGAAVGSRLARRLKHPAAAFAVSLLCVGAFGVLFAPALVAWVTGGAEPVLSLLSRSWQGPGMRRVVLPLLHSAVLLFLPSVAMGAGFPLALEAWSRRGGGTGRSTGQVYAANTFGCLHGAFFSALVLVPFLGAQLSISLLGLLAAWVAAAVAFAFAPRPRLAFPAAAAAAGLTLAAALIPGSLLIRRLAATSGGQLIDVVEGRAATVAVSRMSDGAAVMSVDNVPMAGDGVHRSAAKSLAHLAALLHGRAESALTVGFGAGETAECLARHGIARIDCVEIAPQVVAAAERHFTHVNGGPALLDKLHLFYMDARNYLRFTRRRYDIILNDSDVHSTAGSAPLYTREHFAAALAHLNPGGLFITKLHLQGDPPANFNAIGRTFADVFDHVTVWFPVTRPYILLYLVGSAGPQTFDPARIDSQLARPAVADSMGYMLVRDSVDLLGWYVGDRGDLLRRLPPGPINTDWRPCVEFNADSETLTMRGHFGELMAELHSDSLRRHLDLSALPPQRRQQWLERLDRMRRAADALLAAHGRGDFPAGLLNVWRAVQAWGDHPAVVERRAAYLEDLRLAMKADLLKADDVLAALDGLGGAGDGFALGLLARAWALQRKGRPEQALAAAQQALRLYADCPEIHATLAAIFSRLGRPEAARDHESQARRLWAAQRGAN